MTYTYMTPNVLPALMADNDGRGRMTYLGVFIKD